jgi:23S rRNA (pseudouridine1915-N3)-methyltransferase
VSFELKIITDIKNAKNLSEQQQKDMEGQQILTAIANSANAELWLLDERGKQLSSMQFADYVQKKLLDSTKNLIFAAGGAYGFSDAVYAQAAGQLSLSPMTFSHQMVRLFFVEQLYRAFTIIGGEPYHHL